mgnify:FL=1|jgi:hypothetical protein
MTPRSRKVFLENIERRKQNEKLKGLLDKSSRGVKINDPELMKAGNDFLTLFRDHV